MSEMFYSFGNRKCLADRWDSARLLVAGCWLLWRQVELCLSVRPTDPHLASPQKVNRLLKKRSERD